MSNMHTEGQPQPLSAKSYAVLSGVAFVVSIGLLLLYILKAPWLNQFGVNGQVYYVLLVPLGLAFAAFIFGAMRSYAHYTGSHVSGAIELGGPVVGAFGVILLGFYLVPTSDFDVTVRVYGPGRQQLTAGSIALLLDKDQRIEPIDSKGEADFKGIPSRFRGGQVEIRAEVPNYKQQVPKVTVSLTDIIEIDLIQDETEHTGNTSTRTGSESALDDIQDDINKVHSDYEEANGDLRGKQTDATREAAGLALEELRTKASNYVDALQHIHNEGLRPTYLVRKYEYLAGARMFWAYAAETASEKRTLTEQALQDAKHATQAVNSIKQREADGDQHASIERQWLETDHTTERVGYYQTLATAINAQAHGRHTASEVQKLLANIPTDYKKRYVPSSNPPLVWAERQTRN